MSSLRREDPWSEARAKGYSIACAIGYSDGHAQRFAGCFVKYKRGRCVSVLCAFMGADALSMEEAMERATSHTLSEAEWRDLMRLLLEA